MRISVHRFICLLFLGILILMLVSACNTATDTSITSHKQPVEDCKIVQHMMGKTCIPRNSQRIVALWMGTFRSTLALGIKPIATVWSPSDPLPKHLQSNLNDAESVTILDWQPSLEKILLLKPDLILSNTRFQNIYKQLSYIAPTVVLNQPRPPLPWQKHLEDVAKILDKKQENKQLVNNYWHRIEYLKQALGDQRHQMQISVVTVSPPYGIFTYGEKHPTGKVLNDLGLQRPAAQRGDFFTRSNISQEHLSEIDGDVIFISYGEGEAAKEALHKLQQEPLWRKLKAVQQNRVYLVDSDHWYAFDILAMNAVLDDLEKYLVNTP